MAKHTVILLDDSELTHRRVTDAFRDTDVTVECTTSWSVVAERCLGGTPPDLLILDLKMPGLDGVSVGRALRRRVRFPIVIFSSESEARIEEAVLAIGADAWISKSEDDDRLVEVVTTAIARGSRG